MAAELEQNVAGRGLAAELSGLEERIEVGRARPLWPRVETVLAHVALILIQFIVLFPVIWIFSLALDPRNIVRPTSLTLIPPGASLDAFERVLTDPLPNNVMFWTAFRNTAGALYGTEAQLAVDKAFDHVGVYPGTQHLSRCPLPPPPPAPICDTRPWLPQCDPMLAPPPAESKPRAREKARRSA